MQEEKRTLGWRLARLMIRLTGWQVHVTATPPERCVLIGWPHTTFFDLILAFMMMGTSGIRFNWIAKDDYFKNPIVGWAFRKLGGIPVNRRERTNFVDQMVEVFNSEQTMRVAIIPEGTRHKANYWKTGFYYMALGANVPIVLLWGDYPSRRCGIGPAIWPSGNLSADMEVIRCFYAGRRGRYPAQFGEIRLREDPVRAMSQSE